MTVQSALFGVAGRHQSALLLLLRELEGLQAAEAVSGGGGLPVQAAALQRAVWPFLQAYGRRDERGSVDEVLDEPIRAWRPGDDADEGVG